MKKNYMYFLSIVFVAIASFVIFTIFEDELSPKLVETQSLLSVEELNSNLQVTLNKESIEKYLDENYTNVKLYNISSEKSQIACDATLEEIEKNTNNALYVSNSIYNFESSNNSATFKYVISIVNETNETLSNSYYEYYITMSIQNREYVINRCELRRANTAQI